VESSEGREGVLVLVESDGEAAANREVWSGSPHLAAGAFSPHSEGGEGAEIICLRAGRLPKKFENLEVDGDMAEGAATLDVMVEGVTIRVWGAERRAEREAEDTERVEFDAEAEEFGIWVDADSDEDKGEGGAGGCRWIWVVKDSDDEFRAVALVSSSVGPEDADFGVVGVVLKDGLMGEWTVGGRRRGRDDCWRGRRDRARDFDDPGDWFPGGKTGDDGERLKSANWGEVGEACDTSVVRRGWGMMLRCLVLDDGGSRWGLRRAAKSGSRAPRLKLVSASVRLARASSPSMMIALSALSHWLTAPESSPIIASKTWFVRCVVDRSRMDVSVSASFPGGAESSSCRTSLMASWKKFVGWVDDEEEGGDGDRDGLEEGMYFEIPELSASRMVERSAEIGGPGEGVRSIGALWPENER
jgi:hypothetical protein